MIMMWITLFDGDASKFCSCRLSRVKNFFCLQKSETFQFLNMRGSIGCYILSRIYIHSDTCTFCDSSNSVTRSEIESNETMKLHQRNQNIFQTRQKRWSMTRSDLIIRIIFCRRKIFFENFSTRPTRQRPYGLVFAAFRTFCYKSIQNGCYGNIQHVQYRWWMGKCSKTWKFALFVKE